MTVHLQVFGFNGVPDVQSGDDVGEQVANALLGDSFELLDSDVVVIAQKIVSKAEGRMVNLAIVEPTPEAETLAKEVGKDPRLVELILQESKEVVRKRDGLIIVEHRLGYVHANAGIDQSNIGVGLGDDVALLLPLDPDSSAAKIRQRLDELCGSRPAVIINDTAGRPCRSGVTGFAIGSAGLMVVDDKSGTTDRYGRELKATSVAVADELAAAASHVMGQANEGVPVVLIRGARFTPSEEGAGALIRPKDEDLFR